MQFPEICLTLGGITTGIQIRLHVIIFKSGIGHPFGTSNTDTWRLKPPTRRQLLVDRSELCTKYIFNFFSTYPRSVRAKKKEKKRKKREEKFQLLYVLAIVRCSTSRWATPSRRPTSTRTCATRRRSSASGRRASCTRPASWRPWRAGTSVFSLTPG